MIPYLTPSTMIKGFSIQNGTADSGGGIYCSRTSPLILDVTFVYNWALQGGAVFCTDWASPIIRNCMFWYNSAGEYMGPGAGGAVFCESSSNAVVENNTIRGNTAGHYGGAIRAVMSSPIIRGNIISGNGALMGGAIACQFSSPLIDNNQITNNESRYDAFGGGIFLENSHGIIQRNEITYNSASGGGGIACSASSPLIRWNTIESNTVGNPTLSTGGGIACEGGSSPTIHENIIRGNYAMTGYGGGVCCIKSSPTITNNVITGNRADFVGGGIFTDSGMSANRNNIYGNSRYDFYCSVPGTVEASQNWWGDESGPFDPSTGTPDHNPDGLGSLLSDFIIYRPWLTDSVTTGAAGLTPQSHEDVPLQGLEPR
jgi:hypothetical protein